MKKMRKKRIFAILLAAITLTSTIIPINAFAAEKGEVVSENVTPRAGEETLPLGYHSISGEFTFYDTNLTPVKTVVGRYMQLMFGFSVASSDQGLGGIRLTVQIRDAITGAVIGSYQGTVERGSTVYVSPSFDLGYGGRRIQIFFDASSSGQSNGNFRRATIYGLTSLVSNWEEVKNK